MFSQLIIQNQQAKDVNFFKIILENCSLNYINTSGDEQHLEFELELTKTLTEDVGIGQYEFHGQVSYQSEVVYKIIDFNVNITHVNEIIPSKEFKKELSILVKKYLVNLKLTTSIEI